MRHVALPTRSRRLAVVALTAFTLPLAFSFGAQAADGDAPAAAASATPAASSAGPTTAAAPASASPATSAATPASASSATNAAPPGASAAPASSAPPVSSATSAATPPAAATAPAPSMDGATMKIQLRDLEVKVEGLKDRIRQSHAKLSALSNAILSGGLSGSRAEINFENKMSSAFVLTKAIFIVDGAPSYTNASETLAEQKEIPIYSGSVPPGDHTVQALLTFKGQGYGVFTYLNAYSFTTKSSHSFTAVDGKALTITAVAYEQGGVTTALQDRPKVEWRDKTMSITAAAPAAAQGSGGAK